MSKSQRGGKGKQTSRSQRLDAQERKRDERAIRNAHRKKKKDESYLADDDNFAGFKTQLQTMGLELRDIPGDGNCLFCALGDQMEGNCRNHLEWRHTTAQYMKDYREDFEPFVEDDVPFDRYVGNLEKSGTYAGNDSIVAFARRNKVNIVIHQLNNPVWKVNGCTVPGTKELHISYHNGDHYSSVRKHGDKSGNPTNFKADNDRVASSSNTNTFHKERHKKKVNRPLQESNNTPSATGGDSHYAGVRGAGGGLPDRTADYEAMNDMEIEVMQTTGCQDLRLIRESLEDYFYDIESTVDFILQITAAGDTAPAGSSTLTTQIQTETVEGAEGGGGSKGLWSQEGTGTRIFGSQGEEDHRGNSVATNSNKTKPNRTRNTNHNQNQRHPNSRQQKQQKKLEKKQRQMERHRQKVLGEDASSASATSPSAEEGLENVFNPVPLNEMGALHI